jgi:predicted exporter
MLPERAQLVEALDLALAGLPFKAGSFEPFVAAVASSRTLASLTPEDLDGTGLDARLASLLLSVDGGWLALLPLHGVHDPRGLAQALQGLGEQGVVYLNIRQETEAQMAAFRDAALMRMAWGCGLIVLVLWLGLGSLVRVAAVLLPVLLAISLDLAVLSWAGERLSLFHLVSLLLVLGIGIDYSLFFSRPDVESEVRRRTLHAVLVCSGSTLAVFGMLAFSRVPVLEAIGRTVSMGVLASFWMSWALARPMTAANWRQERRR